jgi:PPP family 3-phenylpropionic acid transporter
MFQRLLRNGFGIYLRLSFFYGSYFLLAGLMLPYWPVWLQARGLSAEHIGIVLAIGYWIKIVVQPLIARRADSAGENRRIMSLLAVLVVAAMVGLTLGQGLWMIAILAVLLATLQQGILPLGESAVLAATRKHQLDYGRLRLWGSVTFIIAAVIGGAWLESFGAGNLVWLFIAAAALMAVGCTVMVADRRPPAAITWPEIGSLLARPSFLCLLAAAGLSQSSHAVMLAYGVIYWQELGIPEGIIGQLYGAGVIAEIILFALIGRFAGRISPAQLIALGACGGTIRWPLTALLADPIWLLPLQSLHALTFAATHLGAMAYLSKNIPTRLSASGQAVYAAIVGGVMIGAATFVSAAAYERLGGDAYWIMGGFSFVGLLAAAGLAFTSARESRQAGSDDAGSAAPGRY